MRFRPDGAAYANSVGRGGRTETTTGVGGEVKRGATLALAAVVVGTLLSGLVSPQLALASGSAFLFSELADFTVYTPLERRRFVLAVLLSGLP